MLDEDPKSSLVSMEYVLRGALLCPVSQREDEEAHYFVDTVDPDIFMSENYP